MRALDRNTDQIRELIAQLRRLAVDRRAHYRTIEGSGSAAAFAFDHAADLLAALPGFETVTLADLVAHLRSSPATLLQLVQQTPVADAWAFDDKDYACWERTSPLARHADGTGSVYERGLGGWAGEVFGLDLADADGKTTAFATADEAKAAVDAALTEAGFVLVGAS